MDLQFVLKKNLKKSRELAYYYIMLKSLHNVSQEEQMNMFVRFWNSKSGRVVTKCFHFHFFFSSTKCKIIWTSKRHILQLSMDAPNVSFEITINYNQITVNYRYGKL